MNYKTYNIPLTILLIITVILVFYRIDRLFFPLSTILQIIALMFTTYMLHSSLNEYTGTDSTIQSKICLNLSIILTGILIYFIYY